MTLQKFSFCPEIFLTTSYFSKHSCVLNISTGKNFSWVNSRLSGALYEGGANGVEESFSHTLTIFLQNFMFFDSPSRFFFCHSQSVRFLPIQALDVSAFVPPKMNINFFAFSYTPTFICHYFLFLFYFLPLEWEWLIYFSPFFTRRCSKNICCCKKFWNSQYVNKCLKSVDKFLRRIYLFFFLN